LVLHSATKGIAGHNDATLGVVAGSRELIDWIRGFSVLQGACASPYDALNAVRGLRTLPVRIERQSATALVLARALEARGDVTDVRYPGLPSHPQHEVAMRQMTSGGGLVTFDVVGGLEAGSRFVEAVRIAQLATSLGGPETLVTHPASTTHVNLTPEELAANGIGPGTIRCRWAWSITTSHRSGPGARRRRLRGSRRDRVPELIGGRGLSPTRRPGIGRLRQVHTPMPGT
jgi:cystathionine beta-lyase/cystathionine gamma-synthase